MVTFWHKIVKTFSAPPEQKYARDNYLQSPQGYGASDDDWILALSAVYMEANQIDVGTDDAIVHHDTLTGFDRQTMHKTDLEILESDLDFENKDRIKDVLDGIYSCYYRYYEQCLYIVANAKSKEKAAKTAEKQMGDGWGERAEYVWDRRDDYASGVHFRIGLIIDDMHQVRLAALFGIIDEATAWQHLRGLATLVRPLLTMFNSWESFLNHQLLCVQYQYYDDWLGKRKRVAKAIACLTKNDNSPLKKMPYDFGIDADDPYNISTHSYIMPKRLKPKEAPDVAPLYQVWKNDGYAALWQAMHRLDQQDPEQAAITIPHLTGILYRETPDEDLLELPENYPHEPYAYILRADYFYNLGWKARGQGTADTVGEDNYDTFHEYLEKAYQDAKKAHVLAPDNVLIWGEVISNLRHVISDEERAQELQHFISLIETKGLKSYYTLNYVLDTKKPRWGGSFEACTDLMRKVLNGTAKGDLARLLIYDVIEEKYDHLHHFSDDKKAKKKVYKDKVILAEYNQYFDEFLQNIHKQPALIVASLAFWAWKTDNIDQLRAIGRQMTPGLYAYGDFTDYYKRKNIDYFMSWIRTV